MMRFWDNYKLVLGLLVFIGMSHSGCDPLDISPANEGVSFVKKFGHVGDQTGHDVIRVSDGGYLLVGSSNSYTESTKADAYIVKTDSLGNELWSNVLRRTDGTTTVDAAGTTEYVRFHEVAKAVVEKPDNSGFVVAIERTYVKFTDASAVGEGTDLFTKIVMYDLDLTGVPTGSTDGVEVRGVADNDFYSYTVEDMIVDQSTGVFEYVIIGSTTDVFTIAGSKTINQAGYDKTDIFYCLLDAAFAPQWGIGRMIHGLDGTDHGRSIHIVNGDYVFTGTLEEYKGPNPANGYHYHSQVIAGVINKASGGIVTNTKSYGATTYHIEGGASHYDANRNRITILGHVGSNTETGRGQLLLCQLDEGLILQTSINQDCPTGLCYFDAPYPYSKPVALTKDYVSASITQDPTDDSYIVSADYVFTNQEHNIAIFKTSSTLELTSGWPYFFGYDDITSTNFETKDGAGTIIPVVDAVSGGTTVSGYAFTGTLGSGTNDMMGLIKIKTTGAL